MAVNLINSDDITITQNGDDIKLNTTVDMSAIQTQVNTNTTDITNIKDTQVYSTTEKVVGTYRDGKPLYRKTYTGVCASSSAVTLDTIADIDKLATYTGWAESSYDWEWNVPCSASGYANNLRMKTTTNEIQLSFDANYSSAGNFEVTIEYTKTTD